VVKEGGGPDLTLPEAAVLLGTSVESVRRRIKAGKIDAFHDERGRVRVRAALAARQEPAAPDIAIVRAQLRAAEQELTAASSEAQALRQELGLAHFHRREAQQDLEALQNERQELRDELDTARRALEHTQEELTSMWRVMSARKERAGRHFGGMTDGNEAFDLAPARDRLEGERARIQDQIARVRSLSKRRRWPWPQAS
jgi:predicted  nucleic acid-binding Zn-ribbon protein